MFASCSLAGPVLPAQFCFLVREQPVEAGSEAAAFLDVVSACASSGNTRRFHTHAKGGICSFLLYILMQFGILYGNMKLEKNIFGKTGKICINLELS